MSPITEKVMVLGGFDIHNESEWSGGPKSEYSAFNSGGVECEVGELFYSMIRLMKPENVLETGTHLGVGASYMGLALKENGKGHLDTVEFLDNIYKVSSERIARMGLGEYVTCHFGDVAQFKTDKKYQFILLDTEPDIRFREFLQFYDNWAEGGYLFIHDLGRALQQHEGANGLPYGWPFGVMPDAMKEILRSGSVRPIHFTTPRGLSGFYRVHPEDYTL